MATAPTAEAFEVLEEKVRGLTEALKDANKNTLGFGSSLSQAGKQFGTGLVGLATSLANGQQGASAFNGVINAGSTALTTMLSAIGPLGTAFGELTKFAAAYVVRANAQGDALFKSFQDLSRVGGADGMTGVFKDMQKFGLTLNQLPEFGAMIAQNSEALAVLGGTVSQGAKQFADVSASIQQSGLQTEFLRMGLTTKNINEGTASYLRIQTLTSAGAVKTQAQLNAGAEEYIRQQDKLSRLTGKSADSLAKEAEARQANERYAAVTLELQMKADEARAAGDEAGAKAAEDQMKQNEILLSRTPDALKQGVMDLMSGFVNSPEAQKMFTSLPEMSQTIISQNFKAANAIDAGAKEADANTKRNVGLAKAGVSEIAGASFAGQRALTRLKGDEAEKTATTQQTTLAKGGDVDINNQVAMRQAQTSTTLAMEQLVQKGVGPLGEAMRIAATKIEENVKKIPGLDKSTSVSNAGEGRGMNTAATAGYSSNFKLEELGKFIKDSFSIANSEVKSIGKPKVNTGAEAFGVLTNQPPVTTGTQAVGVLSGNNPGLAGPTSTSPVNNGVDAFNVLSRDNNQTRSSGTESTFATSLTDLPRSIMSLANNIGTQTTSIGELVRLMQSSIRVQEQILTQTRN